MIQVAQDTLKAQPVSTGQYEYVEASAESLPFLADGSVDLVTAGACVRQ
jgi:ubiquinone/menaquinone biosynthesis C-methylase UbiE